MMQNLKLQGVETAIQYPTPLPYLEAYKEYGHTKTDFPVALNATHNIFSIPIFPELTDQQIQQVVEVIKKS
jgi:dTDP-4-amino-4,6-dideoxygalactose transaminase